MERKKQYIKSLQGAQYIILELGGGDTSTTVISPKILRRFVAPCDSQLISTAHEVGQRIVYHTCGGMMPILEDIFDMGPDAMETFTRPPWAPASISPKPSAASAIASASSAASINSTSLQAAPSKKPALPSENAAPKQVKTAATSFTPLRPLL